MRQAPVECQTASSHQDDAHVAGPDSAAITVVAYCDFALSLLRTPLSHHQTAPARLKVVCGRLSPFPTDS